RGDEHKRADKFSDQFTSHYPSLLKKVRPPCREGNTAMIASAEVLGSLTARALGPGSSRPGFAPPTPVLRAFARARHGRSLIADGLVYHRFNGDTTEDDNG